MARAELDGPSEDQRPFVGSGPRLLAAEHPEEADPESDCGDPSSYEREPLSHMQEPYGYRDVDFFRLRILFLHETQFRLPGAEVRGRMPGIRKNQIISAVG